MPVRVQPGLCLLLLAAGCAGASASSSVPDAGPLPDNGLDSGPSDVIPDGGWVPGPNRTVNFYVTVASQCSDGGYEIPDGGTTSFPDGGPALRLEPITPISCPPSTTGDCALSTFCSWDPTAMPSQAQSVYPSLFQVVGPNPAATTPALMVGNEVAATFSVPAKGIPVSVGLILRRLEPTRSPTGSSDLLVDIVPTDSAGVPDDSMYLVRARYDLGQLPYDSSNPKDVPVELTFETAPFDVLVPVTRYALYLHIERPGTDRIGVAGAEETTSPESQTFTRQRMP